MHARRRADLANNRSQKRRLAAVTLHQMHMALRPGQHNRHHKPRKAAATAKIQPNAPVSGKRQKLGRVRRMAGPEIIKGRRADQINTLLPAPQ